MKIKKMITCKLCEIEGIKTNLKSISSLSNHIRFNHFDETNNNYYDLYLKKDDEDKCYCGNNTKFISITKGYKKYCSKKCACNDRDDEYWNRRNEKIKKTNLDKYGVEFSTQLETMKEKSKVTKKEKYGDENYNNRDKCFSHDYNRNEINEKIKNTKKEKYGDENYNNRDKCKLTKKEKYDDENYNNFEKISESQLNGWKENKEEIIRKIKNTKKERYDNENYNNRDKCKLTKKEKYDDENYCNMTKVSHTKMNNYYNNVLLNLIDYNPLFTCDEYVGIGKKEYAWKCNKCDNIFYHSLNRKEYLPRCVNCYPINVGISNIEKEVFAYVDNIIDDVKGNERFYFDGKKFYELDIYVPEKNIGIEFDGIYWHSEKQGKDKNYHLNKTKFFNDKNIEVIHVFENEWLYKQDIVKSIIKSKLGLIDNKIYARKCEIREVENNTKNKFLENNHRQGKDLSSVKLGLYYDDELVSIMTFGHARYNKNYDWELIRFCNKLNTSVVGGFSRLLKHFRKNYIGSIISYADKRYSNGNVYDKNGFTWLHDSIPNYWYFKNNSNILESRIKYQKHKLKDVLENYNESITEWENMSINNYNRIWDCGNKVYAYK